MNEWDYACVSNPDSDGNVFKKFPCLLNFCALNRFEIILTITCLTVLL
jgi:hypothetical protein